MTNLFKDDMETRKYSHTEKYIMKTQLKKESDIKDLSLNLLTGIEKEDIKILSEMNNLMFRQILKKNNFTYLL